MGPRNNVASQNQEIYFDKRIYRPLCAYLHIYLHIRAILAVVCFSFIYPASLTDAGVEHLSGHVVVNLLGTMHGSITSATVMNHHNCKPGVPSTGG